MEPEPERDHWQEPERCWIAPPWVLVVLTVLFTVIYAVGGVLIEITAWVFGLALFVLLCFGLYALLRWLFTEPC